VKEMNKSTKQNIKLTDLQIKNFFETLVKIIEKRENVKITYKIKGVT